MTSTVSVWRRSVTLASVTATALVAASWVAICAAAPEFIWQGLRLALGHLTRPDLLSALLLGAILAFFVEPIMRRLHDFFTHPPRPAVQDPGNPLFAAGLGLAFALASVAVHDALSGFVAAPEHQAGGDVGLEAAIALAASWAIVPAAVGLAWLGLGCGWLRLPLGVVAAASAGIAGWLFSWSRLDVITTAIPCLLILGLGYRRLTSSPLRRAFARCAPVVAGVAAAWLTAAVVLDILLGLLGFARFRLYPPAHFWIDVRFYVGWTLGLVLAPSPDRGAPHSTAAPPWMRNRI